MKNSFDLIKMTGVYSPVYVKSFKPSNKFKIKKNGTKRNDY